MSDQKRLSCLTVKEIGEAIKPGLEKTIKQSLKPPESGKIVHITDKEIILNDFKIELSGNSYKASYLRLTWFSIGFFTGCVAIVSFIAYMNTAEESGLVNKPSTLIKKTKPSKSVASPLSPPPLTTPTAVKTPPIHSEVIDDLTDTLSPSGLPLKAPNRLPVKEATSDEE
jgi:hypothetical protein